MSDINYFWVNIDCPNCEYNDEVQIVDVQSEIMIFCNNCKQSIQLIDNEASVHLGMESINKALQDLDDIFKNFGK